ncbi:branched-chain amino acid ABC transporter permease [Microbacterium sp. zg.B48]|uniref:branched-chain amino acid ABC transporter permease n=1 Tax=Microbacterium sp. zg.B48 TaxID=2969408 RepID=UPI00214BBF0C|nr:branched-chain amino acid ABC transporter permease [Microbacterium sp. zg.B48]MCR2764356.1 branched-chain amino acid ABC transporter permease [Microbacterium sp. zg.B48]
MQDLLNVCILASIYVLFSLGMSITWGTLGILNFAHGALFMFSAYTAYLVGTAVSVPLIVYVVIAGASGVVLSTLLQLGVFAPILRRAADHRAAETQIIIGGIGVASILVGIAALFTKSLPFGFAVTQQNPVLQFAGLRVSLTGAVILGLAVVISIGTAIWIKRSRTGLALRAIGVDADTSRLMGVDEARLAVGAMAFAGLLGGLAGALLTAHLVTMAPTTGDVFLIKAFAIIVLGGVGSVLGVVVGSLVLALAETYVTLAGYGGWANAVAFGIIFIILLVRPQGIFGRKEVRRA